MKKRNYISIGTVLFVFVLWYLISNFFSSNQLFLPTPQKVWKAFLEICKSGYKNISLGKHLISSMRRLLLAYVLALVTAVPIGIASGYFKVFHSIMEPIINFYRPLPPLAYYTLLVLWMGIGDGSKICLLYLACFPPLYIACSDAVLKISPNYIYNAQSLGASRFQVFHTVIFPSIQPDMFSAMRTSMGAGYTTLVAAEMVAARSGIGWMVLDASNYLRSDVIFVGILIMGLTGILLDQIICLLERIFVPWKGKNI